MCVSSEQVCSCCVCVCQCVYSNSILDDNLDELFCPLLAKIRNDGRRALYMIDVAVLMGAGWLGN